MSHASTLRASVAAAVFLVLAAPARAEDEALPADQVIASINAAIASYPGRIKEVEVKRRGGRLLVEVEVVGEGNRKREIRVDPSTRQVVTK